MRSPHLIALALAILLAGGCGSDEITEEQYVELMKDLAVAEASGEPLQPVYERHGIDPEQARAYEAERTPEELAELTGSVLESEYLAEPRMDEQTYIEISVLTVQLAGEGVPEDEIQARVEEEVAARGFPINDLDEFATYVAENPDVQKRVESAIFEALEAMGSGAAATARRGLEGLAGDDAP